MASAISGMISSCADADKRKKVNGKVVLRFADICAAAVNEIQDVICHKKVELLLVSATVADPNNGNRGVMGPAACLETQLDPNGLNGEMTYGVTFTVVDGHGIPGAIIVKNHHAMHFYLKSVTIDNFPGVARIHFHCNSWVYNTQKYSYDRIFFANNSYLPKKTPVALLIYRQDELRSLRGDGVSRKLEEWDRIYSYDLYNDLGNPDRCPTLARPVLGGSAHLPYPRRCKTGRPPTKNDSNSESLLSLLEQKICVPCDEHANQTMKGSFFAYGIKILVEYLLPTLTAIAKEVSIEFDSLEGLLSLYNESALTNIPCVQKLLEGKNFELFKACLTPIKGQPLDVKTLDMFKSIYSTSCIDVHDKFLKSSQVNHEKNPLLLANNNGQSYEPNSSQLFKSTTMLDSNTCLDSNSSESFTFEYNSITSQSVTDETNLSKTSKLIQSPNNNDEKSSKLFRANISSNKAHHLNATPLDTSDTHNKPKNCSDSEANLSKPYNIIFKPNVDHPPATNNDCSDVKPSKLSKILSTTNNIKKYESHASESSKGLDILNPCHHPEIIETLDPCKILQDNLLKFPIPKVIQEDEWAWRSDEEFARQMLAGVHPVIIRRLKEFPPTSKLDSKRFGEQHSRIKAELVEINLDGLSVKQAVEQNRLFIVDHHDMIMPYLRQINSSIERAIYATRTFLFLKNDGTLKPLAIELSLPHPDGDSHGVISSIYTSASSGVEASIWSLAKAHALVNDSGSHQLISHWLHTHAVMEPFVISANRQLSAMHPISKLLRPHLGDIISTNAIYRQSLMSAGGLLEFASFPGKHSMEMSSAAYRSWNFVEQGLPQDLLKRGMAVEDSSRPHNLRLVIPDYPYAVDGLEIWSALESWVREYCDAYYADENDVKGDEELQSWWKEARNVGHCDLKNENWWPQMKCVADLASACTTIIWVVSAMHQAVSLGQYDYAGFIPNRPTITRRFIPAQGSPEYEQLKANPEKVFVQTITSQIHAILGISLIRMLSAHDLCMPQQATSEWTTEREFPLQAFNSFHSKLTCIKKRIETADPGQKNRHGPAKMPYTLLYPHCLSALNQSDGGRD